MPRELWKGAIHFGLVHIPVSLYPGEQREELSFSMLDRRDLAPVGYKRFNKNTGDEVPYEQIVKGYEYEEGRYVTLEKEDFKRANVEASQTVEIIAPMRLPSSIATRRLTTWALSSTARRAMRCCARRCGEPGA